MTPKIRWMIGIGAGLLLLIAIGVAKASRVLTPQGGPVAPKAQPQPQPPSGGQNFHLLMAQAENALAQGSTLEAKQLYQQVLQQNPDAQIATAAQKRLGEVNVKLFFSPVMTPEAVAYTVQPGDTLSKIAKKLRTTVELLRVANGLRGDLIRAGQRLKVTQANFTGVVDKSQNTLTLKNGEEVVKVYRCSTGKGGITPAGNFRIVSRLVDPVWKGMVPPGDPENPLGSRWMGFDLPQYGIHGTNEPNSIGKPVTQGCVRLLNSDVEELYTLLPEGTSITVIE